MQSKTRKLFAMYIVFLLLFILLSAIPASAEKMPTAEQLWTRLQKVNPGLKDYSVRLKIKVQAKYQFLNPKLRLTGTYYFKKPDKHKLKLDRASYFLNKYPKIFGWNLPKLKEFNSKVKSVKYMGKDYYLVTLTPKTIAGDVKMERLWIDKKNYTFPKHIYEYKSGGNITLNVTYRKNGKFILYDKMNASFDFPKEKLSAKANATYGKYTLNKDIPDSFFDKK
ncbi:MAG: hypothetical protein K8T10_06150 [Candidatus Eremiobacteraeota bacterium]|nr:hypothetical protein [Candidatus Eremiobacteraeota bacterium]